MTIENLRLRVRARAAGYLQENPKLRKGQALYLALESLDPEIAKMIDGTEADCFYDDKNVRTFLETI